MHHNCGVLRDARIVWIVLWSSAMRMFFSIAVIGGRALGAGDVRRRALGSGVARALPKPPPPELALRTMRQEPSAMVRAIDDAFERSPP